MMSTWNGLRGSDLRHGQELLLHVEQLRLLRLLLRGQVRLLSPIVSRLPRSAAGLRRVPGQSPAGVSLVAIRFWLE